MKELQTLIGKWKLESAITEDLINERPNNLDIQRYDLSLKRIRVFITDLENLNQKILNAQSKSRSVTLHEESKESCSHKTVLCTRDPSIFQCSDCGQLMKGKMDDSGGSMPHEG